MISNTNLNQMQGSQCEIIGDMTYNISEHIVTTNDSGQSSQACVTTVDLICIFRCLMSAVHILTKIMKICITALNQLILFHNLTDYG